MLIDITLPISPKTISMAEGNEKKALVGHIGTHFDVMDKEFPLSYTKTKGIVFDVYGVLEQDIILSKEQLATIEKGMFVIFYTGFIQNVAYGSKEYFSYHPQLANTLIEQLMEKGVAMIGIDAPGVRRGKEHTPTDQKLANKGIFVIENLYDLNKLVNQTILVHTYPMRFLEMTGVPCRVIGEMI